VFPYSTNVVKILGDKETSVKKTKSGRMVPREDRPVLFGVELEVATDHDASTLIDAQDEVFFICKDDVTISGRGKNKVEMVTMPMDMRSHRQHWGKFLSKFYDQNTKCYNGFDNTTQTNNGMHIHISRSSFAAKPPVKEDELPKSLRIPTSSTLFLKQTNFNHLKNFTWFIVHPAHAAFILAISERTKEKFDVYSALPTFHHHTLKKHDNCLTAVMRTRGLCTP
jgi:hypothetical protein